MDVCRHARRIGLRATRLLTSVGMSLGVVLVMIAGAIVLVLPGPPLLWLALQAMLAGGTCRPLPGTSAMNVAQRPAS